MLKNVKIRSLNEHKQVAILHYLEECKLDNATIAVTMNTATLKDIECDFNVNIKEVLYGRG